MKPVLNLEYFPKELLNDDNSLTAEVFNLGTYDHTQVYLMYNPGTKLFKIGKSKRVRDRLSDIRNAAGMPIKLIGVISAESDNPHSIEEFLHKYFKEKRRIGEWFELSKTEIFRLYLWASYWCEYYLFDELNFN